MKWFYKKFSLKLFYYEVEERKEKKLIFFVIQSSLKNHKYCSYETNYSLMHDYSYTNSFF